MNAIEAVTTRGVDDGSSPVLQPDVRTARAVPDRLGRAADGRMSEAHVLAALLRRIGRAAAAFGGSIGEASAAPRRELPGPFC